MTVGELIKELQQLPQDVPVTYPDRGKSCGGWYTEVTCVFPRPSARVPCELIRVILTGSIPHLVYKNGTYH